MEYLSTGKFLRVLKKCDPAVRQDVAHAIRRFQAGEREALGFHKLHGKLAAFHAFSANFSYRVIVKITKTAAYYVDVGTHDIYD